MWFSDGTVTVPDTEAPSIEGLSAGSPGHLLSLIRSGRATTRAELVVATGLARSTVAQRVDLLMERDLVREVGEAPSTGGRPPSVLGFNTDAGVVLVADLGATHSRVAVTDLGGNVLAETTRDIDISNGPGAVLGWTESAFEGLLSESGNSVADVRGIGIGVPGPVEFSEGRTVHPPIMPGWDGYPIGDHFVEDYGVTTLVDNDVNIMAQGEHWIREPRVDDLFFLKIGTGIGSGLILGGHIHRGSIGAAGDIGHVQIGPEDVLCRCGNYGCLEATAGGGALAAALAELGAATHNSRDVVALVRAGDPNAVRLVREAGRRVGEVLAGIVNLLNPAVIVLGGDVADAGEELMAGVREVVYGRSTALATNHLRIERSTLGDRAGVVGAAAMVIEAILSPAAIDQLLATPEGAFA
jgi:predicted NBD/HSP70 family sugar kinase